eukprot:TRINITY_DN3483_c0_g1_i1.p1 TRINITY_DN3483_c0_g1~~TRINITY_DN3483_c0_g1_i1.p1  ORF type:complete len:1040 (-),score=348.54 TRINITY_DN3483_c0_g1_i1:66-3086(-)
MDELEKELELTDFLSTIERKKKPQLAPSPNVEFGKMTIEFLELQSPEELKGTNHPYVVFQHDQEKMKVQIPTTERIVLNVLDRSSCLLLSVREHNSIKNDNLGEVVIHYQDVPEVESTEAFILKDRKKLSERRRSQPKKSPFLSRKLLIRYRFYSYDPLITLLVSKELTLVRSFLSTNLTDAVSRAIVSFLVKQNLIETLLRDTLKKEVENTKAPQQLFRVDTSAIRMLHGYIHWTVGPWLRAILGEHVQQIIENPKGYEVDFRYESDEEAIKKNGENLKFCAIKFLCDIVYKGNVMCPNNIRSLCYLIAEAVKKKFPESGPKGVGGIIFLRCICRALVNPQVHLIDDEPSEEARRSLSLVSKIILNVANGMQFDKEEFMRQYNPLVEDFIPKINSFLKDISQEPNGIIGIPTFVQNTRTIIDHLDLIINHMVTNKEKVLKFLLAVDSGLDEGEEDRDRENLSVSGAVLLEKGDKGEEEKKENKGNEEKKEKGESKGEEEKNKENKGNEEKKEKGESKGEEEKNKENKGNEEKKEKVESKGLEEKKGETKGMEEKKGESKGNEEKADEEKGEHKGEEKKSKGKSREEIEGLRRKSKGNEEKTDEEKEKGEHKEEKKPKGKSREEIETGLRRKSKKLTEEKGEEAKEPPEEKGNTTVGDQSKHSEFSQSIELNEARARRKIKREDKKDLNPGGPESPQRMLENKLKETHNRKLSESGPTDQEEPHDKPMERQRTRSHIGILGRAQTSPARGKKRRKHTDTIEKKDPIPLAPFEPPKKPEEPTFVLSVDNTPVSKSTTSKISVTNGKNLPNKNLEDAIAHSMSMQAVTMSASKTRRTHTSNSSQKQSETPKKKTVKHKLPKREISSSNPSINLSPSGPAPKIAKNMVSKSSTEFQTKPAPALPAPIPPPPFEMHDVSDAHLTHEVFTKLLQDMAPLITIVLQEKEKERNSEELDYIKRVSRSGTFYRTKTPTASPAKPKSKSISVTSPKPLKKAGSPREIKKSKKEDD